MSDARAPIAYSRRTVRAGHPPTMAQVLMELAALNDVVAVNVRATAAADPVAISQERLQELLAEGHEEFVVDAVPLRDFLNVVLAKIGELAHEAQAFRAALRHDYIEESVSAWQSIVRHLDQALFLLRGFVLQRPDDRLGTSINAVADGRVQMLLAVDARDNVAAMDSLRYEIAPALDALAAMLAANLSI
jgi:hypothetical protein